MYSRIEKAIDRIDYGLLQSFLIVYKKLKSHNISVFELFDYVEKRNKEIEASIKKSSEPVEGVVKKEVKQLPRLCPNCNIPLQIRRICSKSNQRGYQSHWYCLDDDCLFEEYSTDNVATEIKKHTRVEYEK